MLQESINAFYKSYNTVLVQIMANKCCNIPQYVWPIRAKTPGAL